MNIQTSSVKQIRQSFMLSSTEKSSTPKSERQPEYKGKRPANEVWKDRKNTKQQERQDQIQTLKEREREKKHGVKKMYTVVSIWLKQIK